LKLHYDEQLSNFAFNLNVRRYTLRQHSSSGGDLSGGGGSTSRGAGARTRALNTQRAQLEAGTSIPGVS